MHDQRAAASARVAARLSGTGRPADAGARAGWTYSPWLHGYVVLLAVSILVLICSGGLVTSKNAGLTVPDWPNSYGYNMFAFPVSRWVGGVFLEHTHRLAASTVGFLTIILVVWLAMKERRRWVRNLGFAALGAVILQGLLGGLRVVLLADWIGIFHAMLAQSFFALVAFIALAESRWWQRLGGATKPAALWLQMRGLRRHVLAVAIVIFAQLALGASMRHAHAGLSIIDFPRAYGNWWPKVHKADIPAINVQRAAMQPPMPATSLAQIHLQMTHRMMAAVIAAGVLSSVAMAWRRSDDLPASIRRFALGWPVLIAAQITLGMYSIWTRKAADVATAHVAVGALSLMWGVMFYAVLRRWSESPRLSLALNVPADAVEVAA